MRAELGYCASRFELRGNGSTGARSAARQAREAGRNVDAASRCVHATCRAWQVNLDETCISCVDAQSHDTVSEAN